MKHKILEADGIQDDLERRILTRSLALQRIMQATVDPGSGGYRTKQLIEAARVLALALAGKVTDAEPWTESMGHHAAGLIVADLTERAERGTSGFWATPLGIACGWWLGGVAFGGEDVGVPLAIAGAILGMSRQAVHEARGKGRLGAADDGSGVTAASVRGWMRRAYPLEVS